MNFESEHAKKVGGVCSKKLIKFGIPGYGKRNHKADNRSDAACNGYIQNYRIVLSQSDRTLQFPLLALIAVENTRLYCIIYTVFISYSAFPIIVAKT